MALGFIEALRLPRMPSRYAGTFRMAGVATLDAMRAHAGDMFDLGYIVFDEDSGMSFRGMVRFSPETLVFRHGALSEDAVRDVRFILDSSCNVVVVSDEPVEAVQAYYRDRIDVMPTP